MIDVTHVGTTSFVLYGCTFHYYYFVILDDNSEKAKEAARCVIWLI